MAFFGLFGKSKFESQFKMVVAAVNALEPEIKTLSDQGLKEESEKLRWQITEAIAKGVSDQEALDTVLPRAFALVREAARRTLRAIDGGKPKLRIIQNRRN